MMTFDEAKAALKELAETDRDSYRAFRQAVSRDMSRDWPEGEGMGSSDVSIGCMQALQDLDGDVEGFLAGRVELPVYGS